MASAVVWRKIAKIAGMLGSDQDGEVVAAARAIGKLLAAEKLSWPDLAKQLVNGADVLDKPIWKPPPPPKPKARRKREPNIDRPGFPFWRTDVDRLSVWARCVERTERGIKLQMSHRFEAEWLPRRYVWRNYLGAAPPDEEWQEWSLERWIVEKANLAERTL
jgi:hypothetical protein